MVPISGAIFTENFDYCYEIRQPRYVQTINWNGYVACIMSTPETSTQLTFFVFHTGRKEYLTFDFPNMNILGIWNPANDSHLMKPFIYKNSLYMFRSLLGQGFDIFKMNMITFHWEYIRQFIFNRKPHVSLAVYGDSLFFTSKNDQMTRYVTEVNMEELCIVNEWNLGTASDQNEEQTVVTANDCVYMISNTATTQTVFKIEDGEATEVKEGMQARLNIKGYTWVMNDIIYQLSQHENKLYFDGFNVLTEDWIQTTEVRFSARRSQLCGVSLILGKLYVTFTNDCKTFNRILDLVPSIRNLTMSRIVDRHVDDRAAFDYLEAYLPPDIAQRYYKYFVWRRDDVVDSGDAIMQM